MFISVDLPAPFSPRSACTSPARSSKSTSSLATTPGNSFRMPSSSRRAASAICGGERSGAGDAARPADRSPCLGDRLRDLDFPVDDLLLLLVDLVDDRLVGELRADLAPPDAVLLETVGRHAAALEAAVRRLLDRVEHGHVDLLLRLREDVVAQERLVGVDADAPEALLLRRVDRAEAATTRDLEDHVGSLGDLVERDLLALRLVDEVLGVAV